MVRVKPEAIRGCEDSEDYWVVNGTTDEIRPYRILYKENKEEEEDQKLMFGQSNNLFNNNSKKVNIFLNNSNIGGLFGSKYSHKLNNSSLFSNQNSKKISPKPILFMYPLIATNKIRGALECEETIRLDVDFSEAFNKQDIQLKQFVPGSAY